jgi:mRNA interferase RelE/StbE
VTDSYDVVWAKPGKRAITNELPQTVAAAALELILGPLKDNPRRPGKALRPPLDGLWSARRATYRVLYRIDDERRVVTIETIKHRRNVYQ